MVSLFEGEYDTISVAPAYWHEEQGWKRLPANNVELFSKAMTHLALPKPFKAKWSFGPFQRTTEFDSRILAIKNQFPREKSKNFSPRSKGSTYVDPKSLPWGDRFQFWALKTYKNRSYEFACRYGKIFNKGGFNRRIFQKLSAEERELERLKQQQQQKRRAFKRWLESNRRSYAVLATDDEGDVPSCMDEGPSMQVPPKKIQVEDDESWYNPNGLYQPSSDDSKARKKAWRLIWRSIFAPLRQSRAGVDIDKREVFIGTSDQKTKDWANQFFKIKELPKREISECNIANHQSETARTMEMKVDCEEKGNVIFMDQSGVSKGITSDGISSKMESIVPETSRFNSLSNREIVLDTFEWKDDNLNTELKNYSLPAALIKLRKQNPTAVPFQIHTFSNCDFVLRIRANPNPFQVGQLQCSWLYDPNADTNISNRMNIWCASQANHCLVNAGSGNIGEIYVKYINPLVTLPSITSELNDDCLNLGKLYIRVLNKLTCPDTVAKSCYVTVSIELLNATFSGSKDYSVGNFVYPQASLGAALAVKAAETLLEKTNTPNCDKPPYQGSRMAMVPQSNQSFCIGTNITEPINALRLDASGQHKSVVNGPNEMTVEYISKVYGLVKTIDWNSDDHNGTLLASFDASPMFNKSSYSSLTVGTDEAFYVPPVAALSSLYSYWSGELRMRLDFVASKFHTGMLLVCYVPLYLQSITLDQAYSYPYQVFKLQEGNQSLTFNVPYMSMLPMYPRRVGYTNVNDDYAPPGRVHIFVVNPLIAMESVSKIVEINVYWAAGDNFNVFIPAQPSMVTSFFPDMKTPTTEVKADEGCYPWYMGYDQEVVEYQSKDEMFHPAIPRYSLFPDRITTFRNLKFSHYYVFSDQKQNHYAKMGYYKPGTIDDLKDEENDYYTKLYWVPIYNIATEDFAHLKGRILGACRTIEDVKNYYKAIGNEQYPKQECLKHLLGIRLNATSGYVDGNPVFTEATIPSLTRFQMDERMVGGPDEEIYASCKVYPIAASLNKDLVGENFGDLKNLCRRYQPYGVTQIKTTKTFGDAMCTFPVMPTGLNIDISSTLSNYSRYVREGPLQVILSGFRFYSGGMRLAIATSNDQYSLWIQHRPDYEGDDMIQVLSNLKNSANLLNAGYAQYLQSLKVNNVVQVEVPYYKNRNCLYAQRVNRKLKRTKGCSSLGQIYIGVEGKKQDEKLVLTIFASVADDFQAYVFQGFPPMIFVDDLQRDVSQSYSRFAEHQMFKWSVDEKNVETVINKACDRIDASVSEGLKKFVDTAEGLKPDLSNLSTISTSMFADILGHMGHCIISPTKQNLAWALVHMFLKYGLIVDGGQSSFLSKIMGPINKLFSFLPTGGSNQPMNAGSSGSADVVLFDRNAVRHQAPSSSDEIVNSGYELVSIIFSLIAGFHGLKPNNMSVFNPKKYANMILEVVPTSSRNFKFVLPFFKSIHEVIVKIIEWVTLYLNPHLIFAKAVQDELPLIAEWQERVEEIIDSRNENKVLAQDSPWCELVEEAYVMGVQIGNMYMKFIEHETENSVDLKTGHTYFMKLFTELTRVRNDMLKRGKSSINRREPFCIWISGNAGIGKSQLSQRLIPELLRKIGIRYEGEHTFTIQSGVEYWNGVGDQPCILIDDFLAVDSGTMKEQALGDYMRIKSPSVLNPNMAALHDKNLRIAPELFYINCNKTFPKPIGVQTDAFWRRRDIVVEAVLAPDIASKFNMVKDHEDEVEEILLERYSTLADFGHLQFKIYDDVINEKSTTSPPLEFLQFKNILIKKFEGYHKRQQAIFAEAQESYQKIWEDTELPHSLKDVRDEHRRAMKFLATYGVAPGVTMSEFFKIVKMFSKGKPLTNEDREKIIQLANDSKKHVANEREKQKALEESKDVPHSPEEKEVAKATAKHQAGDEKTDAKKESKFAPKIVPVRRTLAEKFRRFKEELVQFYMARKIDKQLEIDEKEKTCGFDKFKKSDFYVTKLSGTQKRAFDDFISLCMVMDLIVTNNDFDISLTSRPAVYLNRLENTRSLKQVPKCTIEDVKALGITDVQPSNCDFEIYDIDWFSEYDSKRSAMPIVYKVLERITPIVGSDKKAAEYELFCPCGLFRFCTDVNHWRPFRGYHLPEKLCNCDQLTPHHVWDNEKGYFVAINEPNIMGPNCKVVECEYRTDKKKYLEWRKANRKSIQLGCCPDLLKPGKIMNFYNWLVDVLITKVKKFTAAFWQFIKVDLWQNIYRAFLATIGILGSIFVVNKLFEMVMPGVYAADNSEVLPPNEPHPLVQLASSGDIKASKQHFKEIKPSFSKIAKLESATNFNQNTLEIIKKIKKNTYILRSEELFEKTGFCGMRVFFIYSNNICFQKHYYEMLFDKKNKQISDWALINPTTNARIPVDPQKWQFTIPDRNQIGYARVIEAPQHRSLLGNIASEKAHERSFGDCFIITIDELSCNIIPVRPIRKTDITVLPSNNTSGYKSDVVYAYPWSAPGYCCSILINASLQQPIIGIHTSGNDTEGYAEPICNSMFSAWIDYQIEEFETNQFCDSLELSPKLEGDFIPLGKIHPQFTKRESGVTHESPSLVYGKIFPVVTAPAPISNKDPRMPEGYSPLFSGVNNMFKPPKTFPEEALKNFTEHQALKLKTIAQPIVECRRRTYTEAILGLPGIKYFDSLEMSTSEGFPFSRNRPAGVSNKAWLFKIENQGSDHATVAINKDLMALIRKEDNLRRKGTKVFTIFEDCLKDTRLPVEKVTIPGKTRIFSISPIQFTIAFRVYFMDFMAAYMTARLKLDHAIGINPDGPEWGALSSKMHFHEGNQNFMSGDYKNFGPSLSLQVMNRVCYSIMEWCRHHYGNETEEQKQDNLVRMCLLNEVVESVHLCLDNVYQVVCGAPSGSPITVILNELVNESYMYCAYNLLNSAHRGFSRDYGSVDCYHRYVLKCGYGDDIILNVHDKVKHFFNHKNLSKIFAKYGIGYTDADKSGEEDVAFRSRITEITFLKRGFKPHPRLKGEVLAPLNLDVSIKDVLNWRSDQLPPKIGTEQSIEACSMNAYGHGPDVHNTIRQKCNEALLLIDSSKYLRTWKELDHIHYDCYYVPNPVIKALLAQNSEFDNSFSQNFMDYDNGLTIIDE